MGIFTSIGKAITKTLDVATVSFTHPFQVIGAVVSPKTSVSQVVEKHFAEPVSKQIAGTALAAAGYAAAVAVPFTAVGRTAATAVIKTLIPKTAVGTVATGAAVLIGGGAIAANPLSTAKAAISAPSKLVNVGVNVGNLVTNPSLSNVKTLVTENPLIVGAAAAAAALLVAKAVIPAVVGTRQTSAINEQTEAISKSHEVPGTTFSTQPIQIINTPAVVAPEKVAPAGVKPKKKPKKKKKTTKKRKTRRSKKKRKSIKRRRK